MVRIDRHCGGREPVMLDIVVSCQLGRACRFLGTSTSYQLEDGDKRMSGRQSDSFIVPMKLGNASGGKGAT
ncbi:MAG: hypothetical protein K2H52_15090 [Lachnospiraceae bacterium]|nr:hypothetical protein [Lachnospiraceae bacterium]